MSQISNKTLQMLTAYNASFATASANTGEGFQGEWPPEGDHDCFITGLVIKDDGKIKEANSSEVPCVELHFEYEVIPSTANPASGVPGQPGMSWKGANFRLAPETAVTTDLAKMFIRMDAERLKGHISKILNRPAAECTNVSALLPEVLSVITTKRMAVRVRCQYRDAKPPKKGVYKTEFITENLTG